MNDTDKLSIQAAAKDIISISDELTRLRQTIAQHSEAAKGLDSAATGISSLATTLRKLPEPLLALLQRGDIFIAKADQSLAPATALSETLGNYSNSFTKQQEALVQLTQFGEQNRTHLSEVNQKISLLPSSDALRTHGEKIDQLGKKFTSDVSLSNEKADLLQRNVELYHDSTDQAIVQLTKLAEQNRTHLSEVNQKISLLPNSDALRALGEKIDQLAKNLTSDVKLSNEKLDSLQKSVDQHHDSMDPRIKI